MTRSHFAVKFRLPGDGELISYDGCLRSIPQEKQPGSYSSDKSAPTSASKTTRES